MLKKTVLFLGIILSIICVFITDRAEAAMLRIDKPKVRLSIAPGNTRTGSINVENVSDAPVEVKAYLEDWFYLPPFDGTKEFKPARSLALSCANWITFVPAEFTVPPYGRQSVNFTVTVPKDAKGGHYAVMFFESPMGKQKQTEGVVVNVVGRIGALFYIEPEGAINKLCVLSNLAIGRPTTDSPLGISADFLNEGDVDITAKATYYIMDAQGIVYARGEFNDLFTLPGDKGRFSSEWKENIPQGKYDIVLTLELGERDSLVREALLTVDANGEISYVGDLK
ncbi:MAG: hypothetical protein C4540_05975 [Candidatus Omnitrophota bacterium]|nr:MAG: hypothetical protein C4540_05975 [Candidatus Omnitrophota bacterium]